MDDMLYKFNLYINPIILSKPIPVEIQLNEFVHRAFTNTSISDYFTIRDNTKYKQYEKLEVQFKFDSCVMYINVNQMPS